MCINENLVKRLNVATDSSTIFRSVGAVRDMLAESHFILGLVHLVIKRLKETYDKKISNVSISFQMIQNVPK